MQKFRPQHWSGKQKLLCQRDLQHYIGRYNWVSRIEKNSYLMSSPYVYKIGSHLHYLALHAPLAVRPKWRSAWRRFIKQYPKF